MDMIPTRLETVKVAFVKGPPHQDPCNINARDFLIGVHMLWDDWKASQAKAAPSTKPAESTSSGEQPAKEAKPAAKPRSRRPKPTQK